MSGRGLYLLIYFRNQKQQELFWIGLSAARIYYHYFFSCIDIFFCYSFIYYLFSAWRRQSGEGAAVALFILLVVEGVMETPPRAACVANVLCMFNGHAVFVVLLFYLSGPSWVYWRGYRGWEGLNRLI